MLDNFQDGGSAHIFQDDEDTDQEKPGKFSFSAITSFLSGRLFGLKPQQLFILLLMFLVIVGLLGTMFLLVTGRMVAPFL